MIYDTLHVALLSSIAADERSTNAAIARYVLEQGVHIGDLTVRGLADACHVGTGTVSRFCREVGFASFDDMREALCSTDRSFERVSIEELTRAASKAMLDVTRTVNADALESLARDVIAYDKVSAFGLLKGQAAATCLQVDLIMQGKYIDTCVSYAEQIERLGSAGRDELFVVFSYTGSYFDSERLRESLYRLDRPRIWMVCGRGVSVPEPVYATLSFETDFGRLGHPYQLQLVASMVAQAYARLCEEVGEAAQ